MQPQHMSKPIAFFNPFLLMYDKEFKRKYNTAEQMYVTLNSSARVDNDNPDAALRTSWTQWNINLQKFADQGVNLTNVNSITLGLSSVTGGTGMLYFDDIRLYPLEQ